MNYFQFIVCVLKGIIRTTLSICQNYALTLISWSNYDIKTQVFVDESYDQ